MMKYISKAENLCLMMNLLRDDAKSIQYEAFHVFKVLWQIEQATGSDEHFGGEQRKVDALFGKISRGER